MIPQDWSVIAKVHKMIKWICWSDYPFCLTFHIDVSIKQPDWSEFEEMREVFESHFEWIPVVQL